MTPTTNDSIISRIKKLLALAHGVNNSEHESELAMQRVQEMLATYNLSLAEIAGATDKPADPAAGRTKAGLRRSAMFQYQREMWEALASANYCVYWSEKLYTNGVYSNHRHWLVGREDSVAVVNLMGDYLEDTMKRLCPYKSGKEVNLWKTGCAERICERLSERKYKMEEESRKAAANAGTGISLIDVKDRETHGNYIFQNGDDRWCPCRGCTNNRNLKWKAEREADEREQALVVHVGENVEEPNEKMEVAVRKVETATQRQKRLDQEARADARYWAQHDRRQKKEREKRDSDAFRSGKATGGSIGLDSQVKGSKPTREIG